MNKLDHLLAVFGLQRSKPKLVPRGYSAGQITRLTDDWQPSAGTADYHIRDSFWLLRDRARMLERENDYVRRFQNSLCNNVLGFEGIAHQNKASNAKGMPYSVVNRNIEDAFKKWGEKDTCSLSREDSWIDTQHLALRSTSRDGGVFIRMIDGADNPFGFTTELIEIDQLDTTYNDVLPNGHMVCLGVEKNTMNRVVAYHMFNGHPGNPWDPGGRTRIRVPSDDYIFYFIKERISQSVGVTWFCSAMTRLHHLNRYEEAELRAARRGAEKGGWFTSERGDTFQGETEETRDADGNVIRNTITDFEPDSFDELPPGLQFHAYDLQHPNQAFKDFEKATLMGISAGLNIDYSTLTNDLSNANYSSMRSGKLESQETWKGIQGHFIRNFVHPIFTRWLKMALLGGYLGYDYGRIDAYNKPCFRGRRWPWVDPSVDVKAAVESINNHLDTKTNIVAQNGGDYEDIIDQVKQEMELEKAAGITRLDPNGGPAKPSQGDKPKDDDKEDPEDKTETDDAK